MSLSEGGYFLVDKPLDWSSFHVVNKIRYFFKYISKREVKVGHAGTLDPKATGLLIICFAKMTKVIFRFQAIPTLSTCENILGANRLSHDLETGITEEFPLGEVDAASVEKAASSLKGFITQQPPAFSAKKVDGLRSYTLARQGIESRRAEQLVEVSAFETQFEAPDKVRFRICCSKGTYIRTLAHDLGKKLGTGAYLSSLRRTAIGEYRIEQSLSLEQLEGQFIASSVRGLTD